MLTASASVAALIRSWSRCEPMKALVRPEVDLFERWPGCRGRMNAEKGHEESSACRGGWHVPPCQGPWSKVRAPDSKAALWVLDHLKFGCSILVSHRFQFHRPSLNTTTPRPHADQVLVHAKFGCCTTSACAAAAVLHVGLRAAILPCHVTVHASTFMNFGVSVPVPSPPST